MREESDVSVLILVDVLQVELAEVAEELVFGGYAVDRREVGAVGEGRGITGADGGVEDGCCELVEELKPSARSRSS